MTRDRTRPAMPRTLAEAHEAVAAIRPSQAAPLSEQLAYHQRSAALYAEVAEIDRGHHHEALFMAEQERQRAKEIETEIPSQRPAGESEREK
ncbi:MAG: AMED_5909 family protein [Pseudonocardiaceae bacterium]